MERIPARIMALGAFNGFLAVGMGAIGSHRLKGKLDPWATQLFDQAIEFHVAHALALIGIGAVWPYLTARAKPSALLSGVTFLMGMLLFCGTIYWLAINGSGSLGNFHWLTPIGGVCLLIGWLALTFASWLTVSKASPPR
ncbi:MAG: DUF423 domain-containing protein [Pseudomonadota bacterium]